MALRRRLVSLCLRSLSFRTTLLSRIVGKSSRIGLCVFAFGLLQLNVCLAQTPPSPPTPSPTPGAPAEATLSPGQVADLMRRLRDLEEANKQLQNQAKDTQKLREDFEDLSRKYDDLSQRVEDDTEPAAPAAAAGAGTGPAKPAAPAGSGSTGSSDYKNPATTFSGSGGVRNRAEAQQVGNRRLGLIKLKSGYNYEGAGFLFATEDDELQLKVRGMIQADSRFYSQASQLPLNNAFVVPRSRLYFDGRVTKPIQYQISVQDAYGAIALLNAYLNISFDDRLQFRIGRFKTPFTYEFYKLNVYNQIGLERSIFNVNFQANRQIGGMAWGELFDKRAEYAVGVFDGPRNSYQDFNNAKDVMAFVNFKPFETKADSPLRDLNIGGSIDYGYQDNPLNPSVMRTNQQPSTTNLALNDGTNTSSLPFLAFNNNVRERGLRSLGELHLAYYHQGLSLLASWDTGIEHYAINGAGHQPVSVPVNGYFVQAAYLITGETIRERAMVDPIHPFDLRPGKFGWGAIEPNVRFSTVHVGNQIFSGGLADPNLWTNQVNLIDVGVNWYLNKYVRVFVDWEHAIFGDPVFFHTGPQLQTKSDLFWARLQLYF